MRIHPWIVFVSSTSREKSLYIICTGLVHVNCFAMAGGMKTAWKKGCFAVCTLDFWGSL